MYKIIDIYFHPKMKENYLKYRRKKIAYLFTLSDTF